MKRKIVITSIIALSLLAVTLIVFVKPKTTNNVDIESTVSTESSTESFVDADDDIISKEFESARNTRKSDSKYNEAEFKADNDESTSETDTGDFATVASYKVALETFGDKPYTIFYDTDATNYQEEYHVYYITTDETDVYFLYEYKDRSYAEKSDYWTYDSILESINGEE